MPSTQSLSPPTPASAKRTRGRRWIVITIVTVAAIAAVLSGYALRGTSSSGGWKDVWSDNFDGSSGASPSSTNWLFTTGTSYPGGAPQFGTGEIETYTSDRANAHLDGTGHLVITAARDASGVWRSARLETRRTDFQAPRGGELKVQARMRLPSGGAGYWPAFWMLGEKFRGVYTNWPSAGEIDIMENRGTEPTTVHGTMHCGVTPGGPCDENNGITGAYRAPSGPPLSAGFHTFAVVWDRSSAVEQIRWYVDGHHYFTVRSSQVDPATWESATHHGFFVLLDLAIGGNFPGPTNAGTRPGGAMTVDSVSVSERTS